MSTFRQLMMENKQGIEEIYTIIKGTLTESPKGVYSGFSSNDYLKIPTEIDIHKKFEVNIHIDSFSATGSTQYIFGFSSNKVIGFYLGNSAIGVTCAYGNSYWYNLSSTLIVGDPFEINIKSDGTDITVTITQGTNSKTSTKSISELGITQNLSLFLGRTGGSTGSLPFTSGVINLNKCYLELDGIKYKPVVKVIYSPILDGTENIFTVSGKVSPTINNNVFGGGCGWLSDGFDNTGLWCLSFFAKCENFVQNQDTSGVAVVLPNSTIFDQNSINLTSIGNLTIFNNNVKTTAEDKYFKDNHINLADWININIEKLTTTTFSITISGKSKTYTFNNLSAMNTLCLGVNSWGATYCYIKNIVVYAK